jgi:DNA-binding winged helix-turn-helix (wHTH) protein/Tol biopolymer transport system component
VNNSSNTETYEFEGFRLDAGRLMLYRDSETISLKPKVVETLVALVERRGEVISKSELMDRLWAETFVEESNLTQNIYLLRKTLGARRDGKPFIENFSRRGYRFNGEIGTRNGSQLLVATHTRTRTVVDESFESRPSRLRYVVGLLGGLGACSMLLVWGLRAPTSQNSGGTAREAFAAFTFKRESDKPFIGSAAVSPDGKFIAYTDNATGVWLRNTATESDVKIFQGPAGAETSVAAISPDDNYIYIDNTFKNKDGEVLKISLLGGALQQKIAGDFWSNLSLSPDGSRLAFIRGSNTNAGNALIIAKTDGTGESTAAVSQEGSHFGMWGQTVAWSPDGTRIACTGSVISDGKPIPAITIIRTDSGEVTDLIKSRPTSGGIDAIAWLPNGEAFFVISEDQASRSQIYKYVIATGAWTPVTNDLADYNSLSLTADGKNLVTLQEENPGNLWIRPTQGDPALATQITFGRNLLDDATGLAWSPQGTIIYATNSSGRWEIWSVSTDGSEQKQLTRDCAGNDSCGDPAVSPDGHTIVFQATKHGVKNIWRMNADGTNPTQLTDSGGIYPSITADGSFVMYTSIGPSATLWRVPIGGGAAQPFSSIPSATAASLSPDQKLMAFDYFDKSAAQPFQTCVAPVGADAPTKCYGISRSFPRWASDGKSFYYLDHGYAGIWKQPLDGKRSLFLKFTDERTDNFAFSPDGKSLVVARSKPRRDLVALVDAR